MLSIRLIARLNRTFIMVPEENVMMEKSHFLPTKEITLWKLCHQNELMDDFNKLHCPANKCINYHE
jgi:hypothetical protein